MSFDKPYSWRVRRALDEEKPEAFKLLNNRPSEAGQSGLVEWGDDSDRPGALSTEGLFVATGIPLVDDGRASHDGPPFVGAVMALMMPGRAAMCWPPGIAASLKPVERSSLADALLAKVREFAIERQARMVQTFLAPEEKSLAYSFLKNKYHRLTQLSYLLRTVGSQEVPPPSDALQFVSADRFSEQTLQAVLAESYVDSDDCPELTGIRAMDEITASHRGVDSFDPRWWWLAREGDQWVGCLLLTPLLSFNMVEITYVAVLPGARRKGLGRELVTQSFRAARQLGVDVVTLAVDIRNTRAIRLYESLGFQSWDSREAYLLVLDPLDGQFNRSKRRHGLDLRSP